MRMNKSWERTSKRSPHAPEGIESIRGSVRQALIDKYVGIASQMFRWEFPPEFEDMITMSQNTMPELGLVEHGSLCVFKYGEKYHMLPWVMKGQINIYGKPTSWSPVPMGWNSEGPAYLTSLELDDSNSVIIKNDVRGSTDARMIEAMVSELVDNTLTFNQLQLLSRSPYVFNVTEDNLASAQNYFLALSEGMPAIFTNALGEDISNNTEATSNIIDPSLFDIYDHWEAMLLEQLGVPVVPITKRAQQTTQEVTVQSAKLDLRRLEKLHAREYACERMKDIFGVDVSVIDVCSEAQEESEAQDGAENEQEESDETV